MDGIQEIELRRVGWSPELENLLAQVDLCDPHTSLQYYRNAVEAKNLIAISVSHKGAMVGGFVIGFEDGDVSSECVIYVAGGKLAGVDLTDTVLPAVEGIAKDGGASSIRLHTKRKGMARKALVRGYTPDVVIMRKAL